MIVVVVVVVSINDVSKRGQQPRFLVFLVLRSVSVGLSLTVDPHMEKVFVDKGIILLPLWIVLFDVG